MSLTDTAQLQVMTCLEHELLTRSDFQQSQDFEYLLQQDYRCFTIIFRLGQPCLLVRHYLVKMLLPSGISIEILPKISMDAGHSQPYQNGRQQDIAAARRWVAQMMIDIVEHSLSKPLSAINLDARSDSSLATIDTLKSPATSHLSTSANQQIGESPWYLWLLTIASQKISAAVKVIPNSYAKQAHNRPQAQGKINIGTQLKKNWHRPHYLYSEQATFKTDLLIEQFLATGWQQLQYLLQGSSTKHSALTPQHPSILPPLFLQIATLPKPQWHPVSQQLKRRQSGWQGQLTARQRQTLNTAIMWCDWVLNDLTIWADNTVAEDKLPSTKQALPATAMNAMPTPALMINMNHAFETWVIGRLKIWLQATYPTSKLLIQPKLDWLATTGVSRANRGMERGRQREATPSFEETLMHAPMAQKRIVDTQTVDILIDTSTNLQVVQQLIPDVCVQSATGIISHVIDIKYKSIKTMADINSRDWQQLFAYQQHLQAPQAWLIYPMSSGFTQKQTVTVQSQPTVTAISPDVGSIDTPNSTMSAVPFDVRQRTILLSVDL